MAQVTDRRDIETARHPYDRNGSNGDEQLYWRERSRIVLTPVSAPSVLGLFGFAAATTIVSGNLAGWYGNSVSFAFYAPFALVFGGGAQFLAGMWSYKARDTLATAMHGMWGSFWLAWGIMYMLAGTHSWLTPTGTYFPAFGMWFVMLALLTSIGALAAIAKNVAMFATLGLLAAGSALLAAAFLSGNHGVQVAGGWVLVASAGAAVYTASALLLAETYSRTILPLGKFTKAANIPGAAPVQPIEYPLGMPGSRIGQ